MPPDDMKNIVWFSCGAASAVASKLAIQERLPDLHIVCCDTRPSEHPDNYRFSEQVEKWLGVPITYIKSEKYKTINDVFEQTRFMSGVNGARCTTELKKKMRWEYAAPDDINIWGFTKGEEGRIYKFLKNNPDTLSYFILAKYGYTKSDCLNMIREAGIELPAMYRLGYDNNNCPGCVKASSPWYWDMVRRTHPEVFRLRCEQSRKIGVRLVEIKHHERIFLDELPEGPFKKRKKKENLSCGPECGVVK